MPLIVLVWVVRRWLQIVLADASVGGGFFNGLLGVTSPKRSPAAPDIPTLSEAGLPGFEAVSWFALFAAPGTPKPVADKLSTQVAEVLKLPDVAKKLSDLGLEPVGSTPDELARYQQTEIAKWAKVVKESGATVE